MSWRPKSSLIYKDSNSKRNITKFLIFSPFNGFRETHRLRAQATHNSPISSVKGTLLSSVTYHLWLELELELGSCKLVTTISLVLALLFIF